MRLLAKPTTLVAISLAALGIGIPAVALARAKVVVSSVTEPPDDRPTRGHWRTTITVSNQGNTTSAPTRVRMFLSTGRRFSSDDLSREMRVSPNRMYPRMGRMRIMSRRVTVRIPSSIPQRSYYVVTCLGTARVGSDNLKCHFSGQMMQVGGRGHHRHRHRHRRRHPRTRGSGRTRRRRPARPARPAPPAPRAASAPQALPALPVLPARRARPARPAPRARQAPTADATRSRGARRRARQPETEACGPGGHSAGAAAVRPPLAREPPSA